MHISSQTLNKGLLKRIPPLQKQNALMGFILLINKQLLLVFLPDKMTPFCTLHRGEKKRQKKIIRKYN